MFESAELGHKVAKASYDRRVPALRVSLLEAQLKVLEKGEFPVVIVVGGEDGSGRSEVVNLLLEWMDPRHVRVHASEAPVDGAHGRPPMWRFWCQLPGKGKSALFFGGWYGEPIADRVAGRMGGAAFARQLAEVSRFERMLVDEGALVIKLWLHLQKKTQRRRFAKLEADPATAWRVTKGDWKRHRHYGETIAVVERALRETNSPEAPWTVVDASDDRFRNLTVGAAIRDAMNARLEAGRRAVPARAAPPPPPAIDKRNVIAGLDLTRALRETHYDKELPRLQGRLNALSRHKAFAGVGVVVVFEGNDAAGKGGAIRRVTRALDARQYDVVPVAAPTEEERAQPYLWRFWRRVPSLGRFALFDRSWYGRVLVERVEGFAAEPDWMRGYREIVDFEDALARWGIVVVKFWLAVSKEEQLARFEAREKTPFKRFKITADDWRNRKKWPVYERAVCDMVDRTSTAVAPWHLIEANDKRWARVRVLETLVESIERALGERGKGPKRIEEGKGR
ncbi:MAG TPA: polyphosphate:AMP phosphotransferase [Polyangiaceae bacterium]|jgi:polyphosphate:AMP phosphotransferase|nr:polyphosphate:AMP phosphotransferase [Polyangiaceae bacterium]